MLLRSRSLLKMRNLNFSSFLKKPPHNQLLKKEKNVTLNAKLQDKKKPFNWLKISERDGDNK
jgi:hypothetical protein